MKIVLETNDADISEYFLQTLIQLYFPCETFGLSDNHGTLIAKIFKSGTSYNIYIKLSADGKCSEKYFENIETSDFPCGIEVSKSVVGKAFLNTASELFSYVPSWGMLTGIRPAKTAAKLLEKGYDKKDVSELLLKYYMVNESKASLALNIAEKEISLSQYKRDDFCSLYIGIPFCPSKCGYCSFVSCSTKGLFKLIPQYIEKLKTEILSAANIIKKHNLKLKTIYIGGGTPTILDEKLIEDLMGFIYKNLDFSNLLEYTYESGRPDTVTFEKLMTVKRCGAGRISVNTQTSNDEILAHIGRNHTFEDYKKAMDTARKVGFKSINTDLIAGLPGESVESFKKSVRDVMSFFPENITVHSFSVKKSSRYRHEENILNSEYAEKTRQMIDFSQETLLNSKYLPYYIYRQKNTAGNLENVGFCLCKTEYPSEGLYNIFMMEDMHTVLSCGAGSVTKLVRNGKVERIFNPKYPYEYLSFEDKIVSSAKAINSFYNNF